MFKGLPKNFEPYDWARKQRQVEGQAELGDMERLVEVGGNPADICRFNLEFDMDEMKVPRCKGSVTTRISMECQRCLNDVTVDIASEFCWLFMFPTQMESLPDSEQYEKILIDEEGVDLISLIEDEVMLALPIVAYHDDCDPPGGKPEQQDETPPQTEKHNPFAVLEQLKDKL